ncbi:MAG: DUF1460 domain-containing protein [Erysipelotrichaceae bacterium]|nr:DUF1460 domain-containing protein [Erysipelotrichaceae bacterium]
MKKLYIVLLGLLLIFTNLQTATAESNIDYSENSKKKVHEVFEILRDNYDKSDEEKIELISAYFLNTAYVANRLIGSKDVDEKLVIDLDGLDCTTYIEYLEAFRRSDSEEDFLEKIKESRYIDQEVTYLKRKHFFSDWISENDLNANDLIPTIAELDAVKQTDIVRINEGKIGSDGKPINYIPGLAVRERAINYIPRDQINEKLITLIKTGTYVGFRRDILGLDVTHVGLIIQKADGTYLRNASSKAKQVVDIKLIDYITDIPKIKGILLFQPINNFKVPKVNININYLDQEGNKLSDPTLLKLNIEDQYNIEKKEIENYQFLKSDHKLSGKAGKKSLNINLIYKKNNSEIIPAPNNKKTLPNAGATNNDRIIYIGIIAGLMIIAGYKTYKASKL